MSVLQILNPYSNFPSEDIMTTYNFPQVEKKWQAQWDADKPYACDVRSDKPKMFLLVEFPYPSGAGLHVGHPRSYTVLDLIARKRRAEGFEVMYGMGWDAFGLPAENYALKTGIHPRISTNENIDNFRRQLKGLGLSFDWDREIDTTDPKYYKWTQWMFLQMVKQGLAFKTPTQINFCPSCKTALANEEVIEGACERCGGMVERRLKDQWMLRITQYASRLADELDTVNYITPVVEQQRNWIGRSEGAEVDFALNGTDEHLRVYTTRPDTLFGATYMVIAPEHPLLDKYKDRITNLDAVRAYQQGAAKKSDLDRTDLAKTKSGVAIEGITAKNPATGKDIPVWVSDYVLMSYGTGAIMAVPAHDTRDWEFAQAFSLPIIEVVKGGDVAAAAFTDTEKGAMVNSGFLDGMQPEAAKAAMIKWLAEKNLGRAQTNYKLRDWVFSRQRYWGEPIPMVKCDSCGWVPLPEDQLPLLLPDTDDFRPSDDGMAPLSRLTDWVKTTCPTCGKPAERETDTMPQWAGSCWYFMRYLDPHNNDAFAAKDILEKWMPVDWYNGGMEHTTLHLLYSRFWYKALADGRHVPGVEPYFRRTSHGMILGSDNQKMSKSRGNVVNPDAVVEEYGADVFRVYELFLGDFDKTAAWSEQGVIGVARFLRKVWALTEKSDASAVANDEQLRALHRCIFEVNNRIERMKFNTAVSALMEGVNALSGTTVPHAVLRDFAIILSPFAPHMAEELWQINGGKGSVTKQAWPKADESLLVASEITVAVQVNGKLRHTLTVPADIAEDELLKLALAETAVTKHLSAPTPKKHIFVKGKLLNLVS
jgi:leucyl-tRNA synthetase